MVARPSPFARLASIFGRRRRPDVEIASRRAQSLLAAGDSASALGMYDRLIDVAPNATLLVERGFARLESGDLLGAIADADAALDRDPSAPGAYRLRAMAQVERGDPAKAVVDISKAIDSDSADNAALALRAVLHFEAGRFDFALSDVSAAIGIAPGVSDHHGLQGLIYLAQDELLPALEAFQRAIDLDPACAYALWRRGEIRDALGDREAGTADKAEALRLDPNIRP